MADSNILNPYERIWKTRDLRALETPIELENNLSSFERGLGRFGQQIQGTGYGLAALASQGVQNVIGENPVTQGITDWGLQGYNEAMAKSQPGAYYAPKVARIEDIKSPSDALEWGAGMLGEQLPLAASLLLTGGVGGAVARLGANAAVKDIAKAAIGTTVKKSIEQGALKAAEGQLVTAAMRDAASKALLDTTLKGAAVTGFMGAAGLEGGLSFGETVQGGAAPADAVKTAITVGGINGALELLTPYVIAKRMGMGEYAKNSIKQIIKTNPDLSRRAVAIAKELGTRGAKGFAEGATIEGVTEGLQELTAIAGERWAKNDPLFANLTEQDWSRIKNATAGGLFVGGALGGAGAALSGPKTTDNAPADTNAPPAGTIVPPAVKTREQEIEAGLAKITTNLEAAKAAGDTKAIQELQQIKELYDAALGKQKPVLEPVLETPPNEQIQPITEEQPIPGATETQAKPPLEIPAGPERTGGVREEGTGTETRPVGEVVQPTPGERIQLKRGEEIVLTPDGTPVRTTPTPEEVEALRQRMGPRPEKQPIEETANAQEVQAQVKPDVAPLQSRPLERPKARMAWERDEPTFYSALERATQEVKQQKAPPAQWLGTLDTMVKKGIIRQEELDWSGTKEWLQEQKEPVTKEALLQHVIENNLQMQETVLGSNEFNARFNRKIDKWEITDAQDNVIDRLNGSAAETPSDALTYFGAHQPRNTRWTLPGGENQRELVLTAPSIEPFNTDDTIHYGDVGGGRAVAWVRFNDRVDGDGNKTLFLEEVQSKRHQEGKEKGYTDNSFTEKLKSVDRRMAELGIEPSAWLSEEELALMSEDLQRDWNEVYTIDLPDSGSLVPNAPFKQTIAGSGQTLSGWAGLAFKRMLRYAVENGYDKVAWTTGEQQAKRYNLAQSVSKIVYGEDYLIALDRNNNEVLGQLVNKDKLPNYIGKELTDELLNTPSTDGIHILKLEEDKVIGGEGMKGFYDRLLPNEINKYIKKWGAKVDKTQMEFGDESASVHSVEITPAMRDSVMQGQPLFSKQTGKQKIVTPEMDAEYLAAIKRGDMETAQRMVDEAAKKTGYTIGPVWHHGGFNKEEDAVPNVGTEGMHFGTEQAAKERAYGKLVDDFIKEGEITFDEDLGAWFWSSQGIDSYDVANEDGYLSKDEAQKSLENFANWQDTDKDASELGSFTKAFLRAGDAIHVTDQKNSWNKAVAKAKSMDVGAISYKNLYEDKGSTSYIVFAPEQIKSADPVTYDNAGNVIPLSQRFNATTPDIRYTQQPGTTTISLQDFQSNIDSIMGEGWLQQATEAGLVEVIEGEGPNGESGSWAGDRIRLYTGSMPKDGSPAGVLLHEGKHVTFEDVLGNSLPEYVKDLHTLANNGNKVAQDAITHAAIAVADVLRIKHNLLEGGTKADLKNLRALIEQEQPGLLAEEELAYFVQYGVDAQTGTGFWKRLVNQIKAWFAQTRLGQRMKELGIGFEMTDAMAVEWAKMGLNRSLENLRQAEKARVQAEKQASTMPASARLGKVLGALEEVDPLYTMTMAANEQIDKEIEAVKKKYINTPQWLKAPNEKPTKLNERQWLQVRTPAFKNWFGDWENNPKNASKMVDENGEPMVVYHATTKDIYEFLPGGIGEGQQVVSYRQGAPRALRESGEIYAHYGSAGPGIWFGDSIGKGGYNAWRSTSNVDRAAMADKALALSTSIGNTSYENLPDDFLYNAGTALYGLSGGVQQKLTKSDFNRTDLWEQLKSAKIEHQFSNQAPNVVPAFLNIRNPFVIPGNKGREFYKDIIPGNAAPQSLPEHLTVKTKEYLKEQKHDGVIYREDQGGGGVNEYIAFNPTQIKSAISNRGTFSTTESNILYSMGIQEIREQLWNDPTDVRPEIVNKPGLLQKWRADFIDFFAEMEKKSKDIYDTYSLLRSKKAARIEQARQEYFLPFRKLVTESPWTAREVGDMAAARHIKVDKVNTRLAQRASYGYTKELLKALSTAKRKELMQARIHVKAGKMPDGSVYLDANGVPAQMSARTKQQLMFDLMNKYSQYEVTGANGIQVLKEEWELFKDAAAGFSDGGVGSTKVRTVDDVLKLADKDRAKFDQIMTLFDAANRHALDLLEDGGLITAAEHARLLLDKSAYAPLRRESYRVDEEIARLFQRAGQGGSKQITTRAGTENLSEPTLVLQNALAAIEAAAAAAERNLANKELYKVVVKDRAGWKPWFTIVEKDKYVTHDEDGFLQEKNATASNRADITLINDGKKLVIRPNMHNERAMGFVRAVNNLDAQVINGPMKVLSWLNQIVRWVNVSFSPIFLMTNAFKDPFTAFYNIKATEAEKYTKEIFSPKTYKDSFRALKKVFMDGNRDPTDPDVQLVEKWELAGGRTSFIETLRDMDETWKSFDKQVSRRKGTILGINAPGFKSLMQAKDKWIDGLENFNILFENVMRFSTFRVLMENNAVSETQAARISQDLTTNFTRRGYKTQALGTWWLFFNATVQGNYQVLRNLMSSKKVQAAVGGTVVMALLLDLLGRAVDDDWDKVSEWDKERFIILPIKVAGDFVRIPAPWVYNVVWRTGGLLGEMLSGVKEPQDGLLDIAAMAMTTFNPLGKPGSLAQAISPTGFDPFMQIIENKNFSGNPIGPEGFPGASKKANSELMWSSTPKGYQSFARFVNEATGGSAVESGAIDLKPGDYQILVNFLTGSLGRFMSDATFGVKEGLDKDFEGMRDIPVVKEFFSDPYDPLKSQKYHTNIAGIYGAHKLEQLYVKGPDRDLIKLQEVRENRGKELRMYSQAQDVERQIKSLRVRLRAAQNRGDTAREKELRDRIGKIQERFNNVYQQRMD